MFNANPLMRFDGYYILADWLEIPNLREKVNRFLNNLFQAKCLGIEVPPEAYMAPWPEVAVRHLRDRQLGVPVGGDVQHPVVPGRLPQAEARRS